jgi:phage shock protein E
LSLFLLAEVIVNNTLIIVIAVAAVAAGMFFWRGRASADLTEELLAQAVVIDVRTAEEHKSGHLQGDHNIPVDAIGARVAEVERLTQGNKAAPVVVYCRSGARSSRAASTLRAAGFANVINAGGFGAVASRFPNRVAR